MEVVFRQTESPAITARQMPWIEFVERLSTPDIRDAKDGRAVAWRQADILKWIETRQATAKP